MANLVIREGNDPGKTFKLGTRTLTIGRGVANLIQIVDEAASRRHALLRWDGSAHQVQDLKSHNGLYLNDEKIDQGTLSIGDRLRVGETVLEVVPDHEGAGDATMERRVSDRDVVAKSTIPSNFSGSGSAAPDFVVDLDQAHATQEMSVVSVINAVRAYVERGEPAARCYERAIKGIQQVLAPDRVLVFEISPERKAVSAGAGHADALAPERHKARPHGETLRRCLSARQPVVSNDLEANDAGLWSAATAPVARLDGSPAALVYIDSFADNRQAYVDEDLALLSGIADALRGLFTRT